MAAKRKTSPRKPPKRAPADREPRRALDLVMQLLAVPGKSGEEQPVADVVVGHLRRAGVPASAIRTDTANRRTPGGGQMGNLVAKLPGTVRGGRRLLMAHLDTVPLCAGARPVRRGGFVHSADAHTALGGDNRAGTAVVLSTALELLRRKLPHPPLTLLWTVQEEVGLSGARHAGLSLLGGPKLAFNWDGGAADKLTIGATGGYRMTFLVEGVASHAGCAPELGVSAVSIAALAIADLERDGWCGDIRKGNRHGTSNVGVIQGGEATNVVTDRVLVRAEARSHDPRFRRRIVAAFEKAFTKAAGEVKNVLGTSGKVTIDGRLDYESFRLREQEPCVVAAEAAVRAIGRRPLKEVTNGGVDANWLAVRGIPTVTLGCGQLNPHTVDESLNIAAFQDACRIALRLATASETAGP